MPTYEVVKDNFLDLLPTIKKNIDRAAFIAIDSEFTGLNLNKHTKSSLFDTAEERYKKAKQNVKQFTMAQFGLTAFVSVGATRIQFAFLTKGGGTRSVMWNILAYETYTYNFYLFPASSANYDCRFSLQASSVQFLCQYGFDFNKMMYQGIQFLNEEQESLITDYWKANIGRSDDLDLMHRDLLRKHCSHIARWLVQAREGDIYTIDKSTDQGEIPNLVLHEKLVHRIDNIWPRPSREDVLIVEKVSKEKRAQLMRTNPVGGKDQTKMIENSLGFTRVIRHLCKSKKAIVGHNVYLDLMLIYDKFINHLPQSYREYKETLHQHLPSIYDTKYISLQMRRTFENTVFSYDSTNLSELYNSMIDSEKTEGILYPPTVVQDSAPSISETEFGDQQRNVVGQVHEAGFDSYMCGFVFLRLAHLITITNDHVRLSHPVPFYDYAPHIEPSKNKVNLIRATLHNMCLDGPDPKSERPDCLLVRSKGYSSKLNQDEMSLLLSSYGSVDINQIAENKAVVAVSNFTCARRILKDFKSHDKYSIVKYSTLRHSPVARKLLWTGAVMTAGICAVALIRTFRKR